MKTARYTSEFKAEAVKQITQRGHGVLEVSKRLGISDKSLYLWLKQSKENASPHAEDLASLKKRSAECRQSLSERPGSEIA